jgi:hypothetical protein
MNQDPPLCALGTSTDPGRKTLAQGFLSGVKPRAARVAAGCAMALWPVTVLLVACPKSTPEQAADSSPPAAVDSARALEACQLHEQLKAQPCRTGERNVDKLPGSDAWGLELSHCPLDDCGSGGCTYDVYGLHAGCLRRLGTVHGAWIDVVAPQGSTTPSLRTWGRSGTTHVATEYRIEGGRLARQRQFLCDYGSGKPMAAECPKL